MDHNPLTGFRLVIGAIALSLCTFMQVLDYSIANVSIPYIAGGLATSDNNGTWVITMFAVGNAIGIPLTGFLVRRIGIIRLMVMSIIGFTFLSACCGAAFSMPVLVIGRFLQGFAAGPLIPLSQSLLIMTFPKEKKNFALGLWSMIVAIGPVVGPVLGGWITYSYSWRWIFYLNVPFGILCCLVIYILYRSRESEKEKVPVDIFGIFCLAIAISSLQILLDQGQQLDWWRSGVIRILFVSAVVAGILFFLWERITPNPLMDLSMFKDRNFFLGTVVVSISYMCLFGSIVLTPLWLQDYMGYTAEIAGFAIHTIGIVPLCTLILVSKLMDRLEIKYLSLCSMLMFSAVLFFYSTFTSAVSLSFIAGSRILQGCGLAIWIAPLTAVAFSHVSDKKLAMGQGIFQFFRIFMGGIGASIFVILWERRGVLHHHNLAQSINPFRYIAHQALETLKEYGMEGKQGLQAMNDLIWKQSMVLSMNDVFWLIGWLYFGLAVITLFFKKKSSATI